MIEAAISLLLGILGITILDRVWFLIDYKKAEKGLEVLEHYHYGIILMGASLLVVDIIPNLIAYAMLGAGAAFIYHESKQKNFFAYTSSHFKVSAIIGIGLTVGIITLNYMIWRF